MFKLFGKKETASPAEHLAECQRKQDWAGLVKAYYDLGKRAMDRGDLHQAVLWLHRADTVYSAADEIYAAAGKKRLFHPDIVDDCSNRIGQLEDARILYNDIPAQVEEKAENLGNARVRVWGLLSLARLVKLGERLSSLPGCEALGRLGWAVDTVLRTFQNPPTEEELAGLQDLSGALYELGDRPAFWGAGSEAAVPGGAPVQVFDLNGLMGVHLEIDAYLSAHVDMMGALSRGEEPPEPEAGIIPCPLLPDYFVRTGAGPLEEVPQIKAELERIWSDCDFISSGASWGAVSERIAQYKELDILA